MKKIYLGGGCFWGVQKYFDLQTGIISTTVGYANGTIENPTYEQVCSSKYLFAEVVEIVYNEQIINLEKILELYFSVIDPTALNKQGNDIGVQYRTGIYLTNDDKNDINLINEFIKNNIEPKYDKPIVVEVKELENYYLAEEYHQKYLDKNPNGYCHIKF